MLCLIGWGHAQNDLCLMFTQVLSITEGAHLNENQWKEQCQTSNIRDTKFQNLNVFLLQLVVFAQSIEASC